MVGGLAGRGQGAVDRRKPLPRTAKKRVVDTLEYNKAPPEKAELCFCKSSPVFTISKPDTVTKNLSILLESHLTRIYYTCYTFAVERGSGREKELQLQANH